jgi:precorrin-2 dehydrogenase/sirohydrochlorin ferrochelatase
MSEIYPIGLIIEGRQCIVVGGGTVAERKVEALAEARGDVVVVAPEVTPKLAQWGQEGRIHWRQADAVDQDLSDAFLLIIATDDRDLNSRLAARALERGQLVNAVDQPDDCNFHVPASVRHGPVLLTISTGGASPALSKRMRRELETHFGPEYGELAGLMGRLRPEAAERIGTQRERAETWERVLDSEVLELLRQGKGAEAEALARSILNDASQTDPA